MPVECNFPPLQAAIAHAESWRTYLSDCQGELRGTHARDMVAKAENTLAIATHLGELLAPTWRAVFQGLLRSGSATWSTTREFEALRQQLRALFYTVREALDSARRTAEILESLADSQPARMERLLKCIEDARHLEETVFRDWPSFVEPWIPSNPLSVEESLAEALGTTVDEARRKMDARQKQHVVRPE